MLAPDGLCCIVDELRDHILVHCFVMFSHMVSFLNDHDDFSAFTIDMGIKYSNYSRNKISEQDAGGVKCQGTRHLRGDKSSGKQVM